MGGINVEISMYWQGHLMGVEHVTDGTVQIGPNVSHSLKFFDARIAKVGYNLVHVKPEGVYINVEPFMKLIVNKAQKSETVYVLRQNETAHVKIGDVQFVIRFVDRGVVVPVGPLADFEVEFAKIMAILFILQAGMIIAIAITPKFSLEDEEFMANAELYKEIVIRTVERQKKEEIKVLAKQAGGKHKKEEGKFGRKDKPPKDAAPSRPGAPNLDPDKKERDRLIALDALKNLGLRDEYAPTSNKLGPGGLGTGTNNALGGLRGTSMGDAGGAGGMGTRGSGAGGGGNSLGIGGLGTGVGKGLGGLGLEGGEKSRVRIVPGKITYEGGLTQDEIQRVINRFMNQIKFCYGRELQKDPSLEGKLVASWIISAKGAIQTSSMAQNTMGNMVVEECLLRVINRMQFPEPRGGGVVSVTYPFVFSAAGA